MSVLINFSFLKEIRFKHYPKALRKRGLNDKNTFICVRYKINDIYEKVTDVR